MLGLLRAGQAGYCHEPPRNGPLEVLFEPVSTAAAERELEAGLLLATLMHELQMTPAGPGAAHRTDVRQRFAYLKPIGASCHVNSREGVPNVVRYLNSKREAESGRGLPTWRKFNPPFDLAHQHEITAYLAPCCIVQGFPDPASIMHLFDGRDPGCWSEFPGSTG